MVVVRRSLGLDNLAASILACDILASGEMALSCGFSSRTFFNKLAATAARKYAYEQTSFNNLSCPTGIPVICRGPTSQRVWNQSGLYLGFIEPELSNPTLGLVDRNEDVFKNWIQFRAVRRMVKYAVLFLRHSN
jgi:hypothetical protein